RLFCSPGSGSGAGYASGNGMALQPGHVGGAAHTHGAGSGSRDRQHHLHLDPVRETASGPAGAGSQSGIGAGHGDEDPPAPRHLLGDRADRPPVRDPRSRDLRARPDPPPRWALPPREGDFRDPREAGGRGTPHRGVPAVAGFTGVIIQILLLDIVFSLDSVITAVGMADEIGVMIAAVIISIGVMLLSAGRISDFVNRHPTVKMLALSFLDRKSTRL